MNKLKELTQDISINLSKHGSKLEDQYLRTKEIEGELGYSDTLLNDIQKQRKKQRLMCFLVLLVLILGVMTLPFFRIHIFSFFNGWHNNTNSEDNGNIPDKSN